MHLDFLTIFSNILSSIPWWFIPFIILLAFLKIKMGKWEKNIKKKKKKNYKEDKLKYENNEHKPESTINTKQKGDEYENYICKHFEKQGYLSTSP